ncbi:hypothetical protein [Streptomyces sp. fd1-xmd]|uniref:hypothetical protein n=1 Tax=Streptomyces sp. fd1-xmd TaxID=1812480 RepID=UPI0026AB80EC|nr:hypothetical protein [Streptomyces sp. fd1-xmd]
MRNRSRRTRWFSSDATWAQTRKPVPGSSTALSQSKYVQPSLSRAISSEEIQLPTGTSTVRTSYDSSAVASAPKTVGAASGRES